MSAWETIEQTLDYIEEHLSEEISTISLAQQVYLSPFYFQRLFKRLVHLPVQEYIKSRRLAIALDLLRTTDMKINEIATYLGISDPSNFTRMFKQSFNLTPGEYRKKKPRINVIMRPQIASRYCYVDENVPLILNGIVLEIGRQAKKEEYYLGYKARIEKQQQLPVGEQTGIDIPGELWQTFYASKHLVKEYVDERIEVGISYEDIRSLNCFNYFVGAKSLSESYCPVEGIIVKTIPRGTYIVCKIEAETKEQLITTALNEAYKYLLGVWLPRYEIKVETFSVETYFVSDEVASMELSLKIIS